MRRAAAERARHATDGRDDGLDPGGQRGTAGFPPATFGADTRGEVPSRRAASMKIEIEVTAFRG